jgi:hypothetical protein
VITAVPTAATAAAAQAARNWAANLRGLAVAQPGFADRVQSLAVAGEWLFARDGSLTLQPTPGEWLGGCSIPYRACAVMLKTLDPRGTIQCFLAAAHAAEVKAALERLTAQQAVLVLQPQAGLIRTILACEDFTAALADHRLFFVTGDAWQDDLRRLFADRPGLPAPQQFIKLPTLAAELADPLIAGASAVFTAVNADRAERIRVLRDAPRTSRTTDTIAVIAGSKFGLWDDSGATLASALLPSDAINLRRLDCDSPLLAGPLATAEHCSKASVLVTADVARCDFPDVLSRDLPWVTWVTRGRIPSPAAAGPRDALLVADPAWCDLAIASGWNAERVDVAGFPMMTPSLHDRAFDGWTVLADTTPMQQPKALKEFSSHQLLWESIHHQLIRDPFALDDIASFLHRHCRQQNVDEATLDRRMFIESLLVPAYQQGLVRALIQARVSVRLFGGGWEQIDDFRLHAAGPIRDRSALADALASSRRLIHVWPSTAIHPIFATGLPVLRRRVSPLDAFVRDAKSGQISAASPVSVPPISLERVLRVLGG